jgi:hypothetical protein
VTTRGNVLCWGEFPVYMPAGDCATIPAACGNALVEAAEQCDDGDDEFAMGEHCDAECNWVPCGKPTHSSGELPKSSDALYTLRAGVKTASCALAVCDVNSSATLTTSDALMVLRSSVGQAVSLNCPQE